MNENNFKENNIKIIVKIRGPPISSDKQKSLETDDNPKRLEKLNSLNRNNKNISSNFSKGKSPVRNRDKSRSKSPDIKNNTQINSKLNENNKYTIFTSLGPSNTAVVSPIGISGKLINETFINNNNLYEYSHSVIKDSTLMEFDKVYNETHKTDLIYSENIKECLTNLFVGKNSCCLLFGPSDGGKSFTLRGGDSGDGGLIGRVVQDLFNLVEISKQANPGKNRQSTFFGLKISIYQVYQEQVNDLLTGTYSRNLKIEKFYDDDNNLSTFIQDLTKKDLRNKKDYDYLIKESLHYRKSLAQFYKVNEMKRKSNLVISFILEKRERIIEGHNKISEKSLEKFAQIDFVELASSNFGLGDISGQRKNDPEFDEQLFRSTSKTFNTICNNIVSSSVGEESKADSKLTLALKNTMTANSQTVFMTCVSPKEEEFAENLKCLKFANWLRNQIYNIQCNKNYKIKSVYEESEEDVRLNIVDRGNKGDRPERGERGDRVREKNGDRLRTSSQTKSRDFDKDNLFNSGYNYKKSAPKEFIEDGEKKNNISKSIADLKNQSIEFKKAQNKRRDLNTESNEEEDMQELKEMKKRIRSKYAYMSSSNDENDGEEEYDRNRDKERSSREPEITSINTFNTSKDYLKTNPKEKKLKEVEKSLRDLEAKSLEMSRCIENMRLERSRMHSQIINGEDSNVNIKGHSSIDFENERYKQEFSTLKSDNIIFREDINRLSEVNRHLEEELIRQRNRNLELAGENEHLLQEKLMIKSDLDKLSENASKSKLQENSIIEQMNQRFMTETKIRELETENRNLRDEKQKIEVDFKVLSERHLEVKKMNESLDGELNYIKVRQSQEVNSIEEKLDKMTKEIEYLQRENSALRVSEDRFRQEVNSLEKQRDSYRDKYQDYKVKNNLLNSKLSEIDNEFRKIMLEKQAETMDKKKEEETKKSKIDTKQRILEDMQSRISNYKSELLKQRNKKDDF